MLILLGPHVLSCAVVSGYQNANAAESSSHPCNPKSVSHEPLLISSHFFHKRPRKLPRFLPFKTLPPSSSPHSRISNLPPKVELLSSGNRSRYLLTLPVSSSSASASLLKRVRRKSLGRMQSGINLVTKPRTPLEAASMAAYSRRRVSDDVQ